MLNWEKTHRTHRTINFVKFKLLFFRSHLEKMFESIAIALCRVFFTQQKISTLLSA